MLLYYKIILLLLMICCGIKSVSCRSSGWFAFSYRHRHKDITTSIRGGSSNDDYNRIVTSNNDHNIMNDIISSNDHNNYTFTIISDTIIYNNWRTLINRQVLIQPNNHIIDYEIVGQKGSNMAVLIFCWNTTSKTITCMITEYMPSNHQIMWGLAAGMVEYDKHSINTNTNNINDIILNAARHELEEECHLMNGTWIRLTKGDGVVMDKYSTTKLSVYLVLDQIHTNDPKPRDDNEIGMKIHYNITIQQLKSKIWNNAMTVVGSWACLLAMEKLREIGEII